jgi:hypothetical protein
MVDAVNNGRSTADIDAVLVNFRADYGLTYTSEPTYEGSQQIGTAFSLDPQGHVVLPFVGDDKFKKYMPEIENGKIGALMWGIVTYHDVFKAEHHARFCFEWQHDMHAFRVAMGSILKCNKSD